MSFQWQFFMSALLFTWSWVPVAPALAAANAPLNVKVQMLGEEIRTEVSLFVRASQQRVWEVLTDYERAPEFTRDLEVSKVLARSGDTLRLLQKAHVRWGPFAVPVETVRDIRLVAPTRTEARLVSGSMKTYESVTELVPESGGTRVLFRSHGIPGSVLAAFAGESLVKREMEEHFKQLRAEILRREHLAGRQ